MLKFSLWVLSCATAMADLVPDPKIPGRLLLTGEVSSGVINLKTPAPHITEAYFSADEKRTPLSIKFNKDASEVQLVIPEKLRSQKGPIALEVAENSQIFEDGRVVFSALDSRVEGKQAKLETHPGNHRIGFWANIDDSVVWDFKRSNCGMVSVELTYSLAGKSSDVEVSIGGSDPVRGTIASTGSWYCYTTVKLGRVYMEKDSATTVTVKGLKKSGGAVMNLKSVTLRPAPEGPKDVVDAGLDGIVALMATDATVYGKKLRWEPLPKKRCIGYWVHQKDYATWDFKIAKKGKYKLAIFAGCGSKDAGSSVDVIIGEQKKSFVVKDTGHFQKFEPIDLGVVSLESGQHHLEIRAREIANVAVMDIQKLVLSPVQ